MIRGIFMLASVLSLLLCMGTTVLWTRSYQNCDRFWAGRGKIVWSVTSLKGTIRLEQTEFFNPDPPAKLGCGLDSYGMESVVAAFHASSQFAGFGGWRYPYAYGPLGSGWYTDNVELCVPDWFLLILFSIVPVVRRARKHRRKPLGRCGHCGYNLFGNSSGICPECGAPIPAKAPA
jgi:hypothetical protein